MEGCVSSFGLFGGNTTGIGARTAQGVDGEEDRKIIVKH